MPWEELATLPQEKFKCEILYKFKGRYLRMMIAWYLPDEEVFRLLNNVTRIAHGEALLWRRLEE